MRVYRDGRAAGDPQVELPANLAFPAMFRELLETMRQRSPTFRRQCLRLSNAGHVSVRLQTLNLNEPTAARARTVIVRVPDGLQATVHLKSGDDVVELIAHEMEHVIEQIDGIDLQARSSLPGSGVRACHDGSFETVRAVRIGELVARETRTGR